MEQLLSFDGKLIRFSVKEAEESENVFIEARVSSLNENERTWDGETESDIVAFHFPGTKSPISVKILQIENCFEFNTGFTLPVVLLRLCYVRDPQNYELCLLGLNLSKKNLTPLQQIHSLDSQISWTNDCLSLSLLDGPVLTWVRDGIHVMCVSSKCDPCHKTPETIPLDFRLENILGSCYSASKFIFISTSKINTTHAYWVDRTKLSSSKIFCEKLPTEIFYSPEFTNIVKIIFADLNFGPTNSDDGEKLPQLRTTIYAITDEGFLLQFKNGELIFAMPLGEDNSISHDVELHVFCPFGLTKTLATVHSQGSLFLVDTKERQVIDTWHGVSTCFCEDFVGLGCSQLLVLREGFNVNSGWLLTDTFSVLIDKLGAVGSHGDTPSTQQQREGDSTAAAIDALQARLHNDLVFLHERQREITRKENFISTTWQTVHDNLQGRPLCQPQRDPSLVPLLNPKEDQLPTAGKKPNVEKSPITVTDIWQMVVDGRWVVGVDYRSTDTKPHQVVLVPTKDNPQFTGCLVCSSKYSKNGNTTICETERESSLNPHLLSKKPRLTSDCYGEELSPRCTACVAQVPKFGSLKEVRCHVLLRRPEEADGQTQQQYPSVDCGVVCLSIEDILKETHHLKRERTSPKEVERDLVTLTLTQLEVKLRLEVTGTCTPDRFRCWLVERAGFTYIVAFKCFMSGVTSLAWVRIEVEDSDTAVVKETRFVIYARDKEQFMWTLHHLYSCFPDNVAILPDNQEAMARSLNMAVCNMEKELRYLTSTLETFNKGSNSSLQQIALEHEQGANGCVDVENVRANFAKRKREIVNSDRGIVVTDGIEEFKTELEKLQWNTDEAMIDLTSL